MGCKSCKAAPSIDGIYKRIEKWRLSLQMLETHQLNLRASRNQLNQDEGTHQKILNQFTPLMITCEQIFELEKRITAFYDDFEQVYESGQSDADENHFNTIARLDAESRGITEQIALYSQ